MNKLMHNPIIGLFILIRVPIFLKFATLTTIYH